MVSELSRIAKRAWGPFSWRNVEEEMCFESVLSCFILFSDTCFNWLLILWKRDEKHTTAAKYEFISVSQKAVKLAIYGPCITFFFSKTGSSTRTVVFRLLSPVSLIPIHQVVSVSSGGWGMTLEPYVTHWLTWSTKGIVNSWCKGSLPGREAPINNKIDTLIIRNLQVTINISTSKCKVP